MSRGQYRYDYGDTTKLTPLVKMYTLGHSFMPPGIHAGGLRYHGMAPMVSLAAELGLIEAGRLPSDRVFRGRAAVRRHRGHHPRPGNLARHPRGDLEALRCREKDEEKCILFNFSGHGLCDMASYENFFAGHLEDYAYPQEKIEEALAELPTL